MKPELVERYIDLIRLQTTPLEAGQEMHFCTSDGACIPEYSNVGGVFVTMSSAGAARLLEIHDKFSQIAVDAILSDSMQGLPDKTVFRGSDFGVKCTLVDYYLDEELQEVIGDVGLCPDYTEMLDENGLPRISSEPPRIVLKEGDPELRVEERHSGEEIRVILERRLLERLAEGPKEEEENGPRP